MKLINKKIMQKNNKKFNYNLSIKSRLISKTNLLGMILKGTSYNNSEKLLKKSKTLFLIKYLKRKQNLPIKKKLIQSLLKVLLIKNI